MGRAKRRGNPAEAWSEEFIPKKGRVGFVMVATSNGISLTGEPRRQLSPAQARMLASELVRLADFAVSVGCHEHVMVD